MLGQVDYLIGISEIGYKLQQLYEYINAKTEEKELQYGPDKCHTMNIHSSDAATVKTNLCVDYIGVKYI